VITSDPYDYGEALGPIAVPAPTGAGGME
jgi:hypothetical protein